MYDQLMFTVFLRRREDFSGRLFPPWIFATAIPFGEICVQGYCKRLVMHTIQVANI
jgi:hypothetical protein